MEETVKYQHGGDIYEERYGGSKIELDFSVNTNPLGMPRSVKEAVAAHADAWERYPDSRCGRLREGLAAFYGKNFCIQDSTEEALKQEVLTKDDFICANGAADLLYSLVFALKPKKAVIFAPSFGEYEAALRASGCEIQKVCLDERQNFSMERIEGGSEAGFLSDDIDMVIMANPNNPTGTVLSCDTLKRWADRCLEKQIFLVVDECFNWFLENPGAHSMVRYLSDYSSLFILNAFTKIYAMAGLRLGYGICKNKTVLEAIENCRQPWSVSGAAMEAGIQALKEGEYVKNAGKSAAEERAFLTAGLEKLNFKVYPSRVNYLLFKRFDRIDYDRLCREKGILIRSCGNFDGLDDTYYRVAVKRRAENEVLLTCLSEGRGR